MYTRQFLLGFILMILASIILALGIIDVLIRNSITSWCVVFIGSSALSLSEGIELNKNTNQYRSYFGVLFFRFGTWMELAEVSHFELVRNTDRSQLDTSLFKIKAIFLNGDSKVVGNYKSESKADYDLNRINAYWFR